MFSNKKVSQFRLRIGHDFDAKADIKFLITYILLSPSASNPLQNVI